MYGSIPIQARFDPHPDAQLRELNPLILACVPFARQLARREIPLHRTGPVLDPQSLQDLLLTCPEGPRPVLCTIHFHRPVWMVPGLANPAVARIAVLPLSPHGACRMAHNMLAACCA